MIDRLAYRAGSRKSSKQCAARALVGQQRFKRSRAPKVDRTVRYRRRSGPGEKREAGFSDAICAVKEWEAGLNLVHELVCGLRMFEL
jgi:hypothetical protein